MVMRMMKKKKKTTKNYEAWPKGIITGPFMRRMEDDCLLHPNLALMTLPSRSCHQHMTPTIPSSKDDKLNPRQRMENNMCIENDQA